MIHFPISRELFKYLTDRLLDGGHIALLAPRQSGKAIVLFELKRQANLMDEAVRPQVAILRSGQLRQMHDWELLAAIATAIGLPDYTDPMPSLPLSQRLILLLQERRKRKDAPQALWLFVQNVTELPWPHARALLQAFQEAAADDDLKKTLSVIVTGERQFLPLTYSANSPYRHSEKILLTDLDREYAELFFKARLMGVSLADGVKEFTLPSTTTVHSDAIDELWHQTGGYAKFIEEIVVTARRPAPSTVKDPDSWDLERIRKLITFFEVEYLQKDHDLCLSMKDIESDLDSLLSLVKLLDENPNFIDLPSETPHALEMAGFVRRKKNRVGEIASPVWQRFLQTRMTKLHRADTFALLGQWDKAWELYQGCNASVGLRTLDGPERWSLDQVLEAWEKGMLDAVRQGASEIVQMFAHGAKYLLGFESLTIKNMGSQKVVFAAGGMTPESLRYELVRQFKEITLSRRRDRLGLHSTWKDSEPTGHFQFSVELHASLPPGQEADSVSLPRLSHSINVFWQAYRSASRFEYDFTIGALRERHLTALQEISRLVSTSLGDFGAVVNGTAELLVRTAGYGRILVSLITPKGTAIEVVAGHASTSERNFDGDFEQRFSLTEEKPEAEWDVQRWVATKGDCVAIPNASDPNQKSPVTQTKNCQRIGMTAILVVPIKLPRDGQASEKLGTIHFERQDKSLPAEEEIQLCRILARQIAVAFDHARRTTLLEQTLHRLDDPIRIYSPDTCHVMFRNNSAAKRDQSPFIGWQDPSARTPSRQNPRTDTPAVRRYTRHENGAETWDELRAPILDFRANLRGRTIEESNIGTVEHIHDLTKLVRTYRAFQDWLTGDSQDDTAQRILGFFRTELNCQWCRIYLIRKTASGDELLESYREFGLEEELASQFRQGEFRTLNTERERLTWYLLEQLKEPAVFRFSHEHAGAPVEARSVLSSDGVPTFLTCDQWRDEFIQSDQEWIEAPLLVGDERVGLIALSKPVWFSPQMYEELRWSVGVAAVSLWGAHHAEEMASQRENAWKDAARVAVHQLVNSLLPVETAYTIANRILQAMPESQEIDEVMHWLAVAERGMKAGRAKIRDFRKYASDQPPTDLRLQDLGPILLSQEKRLLGLYPDVHFQFLIEMANVSLHLSESFVSDVFDILVTNSVSHSGVRQPDLKIVVSVATLTGSSTKDVTIKYRDNGRGVREEYRPRLFEPYFTTNTLGNGLGLVIAKKLIERMRGTFQYFPETDGSGAWVMTFPLFVTENTW